jgi:uncharacterized membrane protein
MSLSLSSTAVPARSGIHASTASGMGRLVETEGGERATQWVFKRNCSISPRQMMVFYASLCCVSLGIALVFLSMGMVFVLGFAVLELLALGAALLVFARHVGDSETLTLSGSRLQVQTSRGQRSTLVDFAAEWVRVETTRDAASWVQLDGEGKMLRVGRFLRPEARRALAQELRRALRTGVRQGA